MAQDFTFENQPNGQGDLKFGDHAFQVTQRMILLGKNQLPLQEAGLVEKQIAGFPPVLISGANRINSILNTKATDSGIEAARSINAFWFDSNGSKPDFIFLRIPINTRETVSSTLVMLYAEKGSGQRFMEELQDLSLDQTHIQNVLAKILQINNTQQINPSQIITENLVIFPQSTFKLGAELTKQNVDAARLYQQNKNSMIVKNIPTELPEGLLTSHKLNEETPDSFKPAASIAKREPVEFNPHPHTLEVDGRKITLQGLGMYAKGMTADKAARLGVAHPGLEIDYSENNVFNLENARKLIEMFHVFEEGVANVVIGNPFSSQINDKLLLVKASDHGNPVLMIKVPDGGSRNMYGEDLDWRPFNMFYLFLKADGSSLDYIADSILKAPSGEAVKAILDNIVHADINKAFGVPHSLDDRLAVLNRTEEVLEMGRQKSGKYYNTSYYSNPKNITAILTETLIKAPPRETK